MHPLPARSEPALSRIFGAAALAIALTCGPAHAGVSKLAWHDCRGDGGSRLKHFACDTNSGDQIVVGSFVLSEPLPGFVGHEVVIDAQSTTPSLPAWWQVFNAGSCRGNAVTVDFDFTLLANQSCQDPFGIHGATGQGGLAAWCVPGTSCVDAPLDPSRVRIKLAGAMPDEGNLDAGVEYYAHRMRIANTKTTGTGSCTGCSTPVCFVQTSAKVVSLAGSFEIAVPGSEADIGWQCAQVAGTLACMTSLGDCATPVRNQTWGQIKSLWR